MSRDEGVLWTLAANFALLSLMAVGGVNTVLPEMHRQSVEVYGWMTTERFTDLFAIAQGAPGPNIVIATLIGWSVAGLPGALAATVAMTVPTALLAYVVTGLWDRFRLAPWRIAIQAGLVPVTIGLVAAGAYVVARAADTSLVAFAVTIATAIALLTTRLHPLICLAVGGALGLVGAL